MASPKLSVCIPVYNFGAFLDETLQSIMPQATGDIEVLVVDGASSDNTSQVMAEWLRRYPQIRYVVLERRGGIDADLAATVELAHGEYCWLFSGDDIMRPYAIWRALEQLHTKRDLYICKHTICDRDMRVLWDHPVFKDDKPRVAELADRDQRTEWLGAAFNTEALFSFMSTLIVSRARWQSVQPAQKFIGSCWGHVARLLTLAQTSLTIQYVPVNWLDKRGDNDSFLERGVVNRFRIAVDGFVGIATHFYGQNSIETENVRRLLRNELSVLSFFYARDRALESPATEDRAELDRIFSICYGGKGFRNWIARALYYWLPIAVYRGLKSVYKVARAPWRWLRRQMNGHVHV